MGKILCGGFSVYSDRIFWFFDFKTFLKSQNDIHIRNKSTYKLKGNAYDCEM